MWKDFIHIFVLSCKQATFLIEKRLHVPLSRREKLQLGIHLSICRLCREYDKKAAFLNGIMKKILSRKESRSQFHPDELREFKDKLKNKINKK
ncbi:hypothetical protein [uncultured Parabacteroides sp.]|jgi:predicted anti-sigma-YlaC factor YlaD|uniref:hypothetical protein n=1 Tax=uncultured Parabacteroides sp. TaxID=512312 RepID=UPI0025E829D7|nr:hypothetical protein [uncultured Parabacteroides sp.]